MAEELNSPVPVEDDAAPVAAPAGQAPAGQAGGAVAAAAPVIDESEDELYEDDDSLVGRFMEWVRTELVWYAGSFTVHLLGLSLLLLMGNFASKTIVGDAPSFDEVQNDRDDKDMQKIEKFDIGDSEESQPTELDVDPTLEKAGQQAQTEDYNDDNAVYTPKGGGMATGNKDANAGGIGFAGIGNGAKANGQGIGVGLGTGKGWGTGGDNTGFGGRGSGHRKAMVAIYGGTKHTERAVTGALVWLQRHQMADGSWSLQNYIQRCSDKSCTGPGTVVADAGATALGLLPFLAAGQTHRTRGPYKATVANGIAWLVRHQDKDGNLAKGSQPVMYSHGLATIALCEAFGLTRDQIVGNAAQGGVNFIMKAQNPVTGGWRYNPGDDGDTSVVGWQLMALKSAHMAGLSIGGSTFTGTNKWLDSCQHGTNHSEYSYQPNIGASPTMTAVGLLCRQYMGATRDNAMMRDGMQYLMRGQPDPHAPPNIYYFYYATQVMHNMSGQEWDTWNRKMRKVLVDTQKRDAGACGNGSWDPAPDPWGKSGGRVMVTSLSCLTLEIYYRYLPLFKAEAQGPALDDKKPAGGKSAPPAEAIPKAARPPAQPSGKK